MAVKNAAGRKNGRKNLVESSDVPGIAVVAETLAAESMPVVESIAVDPAPAVEPIAVGRLTDVATDDLGAAHLLIDLEESLDAMLADRIVRDTVTAGRSLQALGGLCEQIGLSDKAMKLLSDANKRRKAIATPAPVVTQFGTDRDLLAEAKAQHAKTIRLGRDIILGEVETELMWLLVNADHSVDRLWADAERRVTRGGLLMPRRPADDSVARIMAAKAIVLCG